MNGNNKTEARSRISPAQLAAIAPRRSALGRDVRVGLFVIAGFLAVVVALFLLTDPGTMRGRYHVSTTVSNAGGIRKGDPVQLLGVNIGRVRAFRINPQGGVEVRLELEKEYPVPSDSRVTLRSNGLLGGVVADISPGRATTVLGEGAVLRSSAGEPGLEQMAGDLGGKADTLLVRANALLSEQMIGNVHASASELQKTLVELSALAGEQRRELAAMSASLRRSAAGVEAAATRPELVRAIARTDSITAQLDQATGQLNVASTSLASVLGRIERGEGTLGKLSRDESLYDNLNAAAQNISQTATSARALTDDIRTNPKKYINVSVF
jgi:phospholipid/cholesterol/gamma-HCH transport system substrate-binding protein